MKIGYDAKRMLNNPTGLGNHARILLNAMMRDYRDNDYLLFSPQANNIFLDQLHGDYKVYFPQDKLSRSIHPWWRSYGITDDLLKNRIDLYHGISNELPFNIHRLGIRPVVTIHDLIFLKHKEQYPWLDRQFYILKTKYAAAHADAIIAVSRETKQDLIDRYQVPERKISVIYPSVDESFYHKVADTDREAIVKRYKLPEKYILNVSSFFPRKNQIRLIEAYDRIKDRIEQDLVLVGSAGGMLPDIQKLIATKKLQDRVHIITDISNNHLPAVYQSAGLFVFPSLFEGFGAPALEALASGVPVIASHRGAVAEAAGAGSIFIEPYEVEDISEKIAGVLKDKAIRMAMVQSGYAHAQTMTDQIFAKKTMDVYEKK